MYGTRGGMVLKEGRGGSGRRRHDLFLLFDFIRVSQMRKMKRTFRVGDLDEGEREEAKEGEGEKLDINGNYERSR